MKRVQIGQKNAAFRVAPRAGAWIETKYDEISLVPPRSRPARARGLKPPAALDGGAIPWVAPRAGAWIETSTSHMTFASVSWSRPARARGLKRNYRFPPTGELRSRPARARGLKHPRETVLRAREAVAPRAGAWIETRYSSFCRAELWVAPRAGAWIETLDRFHYRQRDLGSRPARARGLKPPLDATTLYTVVGRAPRGRVD